MFSDRTFEKFNKKDYQRLFLMGAVLGGLIFVLIYGIYVLNPSYTQWIFYGDYDLRQHFMGWCHYRNTGWKFPIGLIDTLSYPVSMSTIYTDSIPGIALLFKLISGILPIDFQYFGLVGFLFYALSGGTTVILLKRFIKSPWICLLTSPVFVVSFPMIQRMFYHTALAAQWIILLCFIIWVYDDFSKKSIKSVIIWGIMGFVCVSIHSYFLPMAGMIMLSDRITWFLVNGKIDIKNRIIHSLLPIVSFCITAIFALYIYGGFYGQSSGVGEGLGTFGANFNTFINPGYYGTILPEMGYDNYFQYEGCGYLGLGIILLSLFVDVMLVMKLKSRKDIKKYIPNQNIYLWVSLGLFIVSFLVATLPTVSWCTKHIFTLPLPSAIYRLASVFRSNGRFIWVSMYMIMLFTVVLGTAFLEDVSEKIVKDSDNSATVKRKGFVYGVLIIVLLIQLADLSMMIKDKHAFYARNDYTYTTIWETDPELSKMISGKKNFVFMLDDGNLNMETAFYAYRHGMSQNWFYFARDIRDEIDDNIAIYTDELKEGMVRSDTVYIVTEDDFNGLSCFLDETGIIIKKIDNKVFFVSKQ